MEVKQNSFREVWGNGSRLEQFKRKVEKKELERIRDSLRSSAVNRNREIGRTLEEERESKSRVFFF